MRWQDHRVIPLITRVQHTRTASLTPSQNCSCLFSQRYDSIQVASHQLTWMRVKKSMAMVPFMMIFKVRMAESTQAISPALTLPAISPSNQPIPLHHLRRKEETKRWWTMWWIVTKVNQSSKWPQIRLLEKVPAVGCPDFSAVMMSMGRRLTSVIVRCPQESPRKTTSVTCRVSLSPPDSQSVIRDQS